MDPYFQKDRLKLFLGDSLPILQSIDSQSFDMIFADPPYFLSNSGGSVYNGEKVFVDKGVWDKSRGFEMDVNFHKKWIEECARILKINGTIWISGTHHSIYQCGFLLQSLGFQILNEIVWYKSMAPKSFSGRFFTHSHETLIWAKKAKSSKHTFNYKYLKDSVWPEDFLKQPSEEMRSVWAIPAVRSYERTFGVHPTQKPSLLLKRIILSCTKKGDFILDPFVGSGTTGLEAFKYGREFVGIDSSRKYLDLAIKRFECLCGNLHKTL